MESILSKDEIKQFELAKMATEISCCDWSLLEKVALVCRILFEAGHDSGLSGQISARVNNAEFITQSLGVGFDEVSVSNLLTVSSELNVVSGKGMPNPANRFHSWIYAARPDVNCIVHTHPIYTAALSMLEVPLIVGHTDSCVLFDEVNFLPKWDGIPVGNSEGETITKALGSKKALLLGHHGLVTVARNVEEACILALQFERAARLQLMAMSAGQIVPIESTPAAEAHDWLLQENRVNATFSYYARRALRVDSSCLS
ncbi:MAG: aldolase [Pseudomonas sp.]|nr:aldolase [Pseudomonas sp.]MDP3847608.1 aldolase [Pseudomonas sp.]